ncbi:hypothetical protein [Sporosarcina sp. NPDC096371]|uniref:hypothetical protein n=1 Tax=Sporosarcina sp. NPDC096371 TaxID=3364530 RepID=UPI003803A300
MHYFHPLWIAPEGVGPIHANVYALSQTAPRPENLFPPVDTHQLHASAGKMLEIIKQAQLLINKVVDSSEFAFELMNASQLSNQQKVDELIKSTGVTSKIKTKFNPSGIHIELDNAEKLGECCKLLIALQW